MSTTEALKRPEPSDADRKLEASVRQAVGNKRAGHVVVLNKELGTGYVQEEETGVRFAFSRRFVSAYDELSVSTPVEFYANGYNAVAELSVLKT